MAKRAAPLLLPLALGLPLAGCGGAAANDPVSVVTGYMQAVQGGDAGAGQTFLLSAFSDEKVTGTTDASRYMAENKGATWKVVPVSWIPPGGSSAQPSDKECLIGAPPPSQLCIVTVEVDTGAKKVWFHFDVESRYGPYQIINVDRVDTKPDDLLPQGTEAHSAT